MQRLSFDDLQTKQGGQHDQQKREHAQQNRNEHRGTMQQILMPPLQAQTNKKQHKKGNLDDHVGLRRD